MRLKPELFNRRRTYVFDLLRAEPGRSYASIQRGLRDNFGQAMQQKVLRRLRSDFDTLNLFAPIENQ